MLSLLKAGQSINTIYENLIAESFVDKESK